MLLSRLPGPDAAAVSSRLREGELIQGLTVIETPGHTPGHISLWREPDRLLICGDRVFNLNPLTRRVGLREPFGFITADPALNRRSIGKLAELEPATVLPGHGPPIDGADFEAFANGLG